MSERNGRPGRAYDENHENWKAWAPEAAKITDEAVEVALDGWNSELGASPIVRLRAALEAALPHLSGVSVKPLVWEKGIVDWARPQPGMKYVACSTTPLGSWAWWLDDAPETKDVFPSETEAKAAAQADYERRIMSALETVK